MDSRFPTYYMNDRRVMRMTADQFRFFVLATAWSVSNKTDGWIERGDLYLIPFADEDLPPALVDLGAWTAGESGWLIADFDATQTSAAKMEAALKNRLKADAERQKKKYDNDKAKAEAEPTSTDQSSREAHVSFERQRKGKAEAEAEALGEEVLPLDESSHNPTTPNGTGEDLSQSYREQIEQNNIRSIDDLMSFQKMKRPQAEKIWFLAYPGRAA